MEILGKSPIPLPVLIIGKTAFGVCWIFPILPWLDPQLTLYETGGMTIAGWFLYAAGLAVVTVALVNLGRSAAVGLPTQPTEFKSQGLYRFTRNPIYLGAFAMCIGSCLIAVHPINIVSCLTAIVIHHQIVRREERFLEARFGDAYRSYKERVPRYIGI